MDPDLEGEHFPTRDITVISSLHGRQRREERGIQKHELKEAIKHGKCERANPGRDGKHRWKYTYNGCVYVTDASSRHEITSWKVPHISSNHEGSGAIDDGDDIGCHVVLLVDCSGSMRKNDVPGYDSRTEAVYDTLLKDFMQYQLEHPSQNKIVVTLIEMSSESRIIFKRQLLTEKLCGVLDRRKRVRAKSHGNYLPALDAVNEALQPDQWTQHQLFVVFLSDGAPSDQHFRNCEHGVAVWQYDENETAPRAGAKPKFRTCPGKSARCRYRIMQDVRKECSKKVAELGVDFGLDRMFIATVAFGAESEDYSVLREMAAQLPRSSFQKLGLSLNFLRTHLSSLTGTLTSLCTEVLSQNLTVRKLRLQDRSADTAWNVYSRGQIVECLRRNHAHGGIKGNAFVDGRHAMEGEGIRVATLPFEKGAEWVVSKCSEVVGTVPVGRGLVAKQPLHEELLCTQEFYLKSCRVQSDAAHIAQLFNRRLQMDGAFHVHFVPCAVYKVEERGTATEHSLQWFKVEEELSGRWTKWNDNGGKILRWQPPESHPAAEDDTQNGTGKAALEVIREEDSEAEVRAGPGDWPRSQSDARADQFDPADVPQCFSHFSHSVTEGKHLVCDLQGTWNSTDGFTLTDPVVHFASRTGRRRGKNGRTDKGTEGMRLFFTSHICNRLCRRLGLEKPSEMQFVLRNAILDFFDERSQAGKRQLAGWAAPEILLAVRSRGWECCEQTTNSMMINELHRLQCEGILTTADWSGRFLTVESQQELQYSRKFFAAWNKFPRLFRLSSLLRRWNREVEKAVGMRREISLHHVHGGIRLQAIFRFGWGERALAILERQITSKNLVDLAQRICDSGCESPTQLQALASMILNRAVADANCCQLMAQLCYLIKDSLAVFRHSLIGDVTFTRCLLGVCQDALEKLCMLYRGMQEQNEVGSSAATLAWTGRGIAGFLGELFNCEVVGWPIVEDCVRAVQSEKTADLAVVCLCQLVVCASSHSSIPPIRTTARPEFPKRWQGGRHMKIFVDHLRNLVIFRAVPCAAKSVEELAGFVISRPQLNGSFWDDLGRMTRMLLEDAQHQLFTAPQAKCYISLPGQPSARWSFSLSPSASTLEDIRNHLETLDWNHTDVKWDGGVLIKRLGTDCRPSFHTANSKVTLRMQGRVLGADRRLFMAEHEQDVLLGTEVLPEALEKSLESIGKDQCAVVELQPRYAYGDMGSAEHGVPAGAHVELVVLVTRVTPFNDLPTREQMHIVQHRTKVGNRLAKLAKFGEAVAQYQTALELIPLAGRSDQPEDATPFAEIKTKCHVNRAVCFDKMLDFRRCVNVLAAIALATACSRAMQGLIMVCCCAPSHG